MPSTRDVSKNRDAWQKQKGRTRVIERKSNAADTWIMVAMFGFLALSLSMAIERYAPAADGTLAFVAGFLLGLSIVLNGVAIYKLAATATRKQ